MTVRVLVGDARAMLATLPAASVQTCITSPPYWGLRSYGTNPQVWGDSDDCEHVWGEPITAAHANKTGLAASDGTAWDVGKNGPAHLRPREGGAFCSRCGGWRGELGSEPTPDLYVEHLVSIFRAVRRVLRPDGTLWLNLGDSFAGSGKGGNGGHTSQLQKDIMRQGGELATTPVPGGTKPKDLLLMPYRVVLALQADGWWVRSQIVWAKKSCMPESVTDRPTNAWEPIFLLTKSRTYFYDAEAVREPGQDWGGRDRSTSKHNTEGFRIAGQPPHRGLTDGNFAERGANMRNVWHLGPEPFSGSHFATFVTEIPRRCILAGTSARGGCPRCGAPWRRTVERERLTPAAPSGWRETGRWDANGGNGGDLARTRSTLTGWQPSCRCEAGEPVPQLVLDPFAGAGTSLLVADRLGRDAVGIELNEGYAALAESRIRQDAPLFAGVQVA